MGSQQKDDSRYEFQMPKFWDFTNSIPQKRPDESWFCPENVSGPSFPGLRKKRRRPLRVKHPLNKPAELHSQHAKAPVVPEKSTGNVFDRLSTHSTISASKKMHPHLSVEKGRPTPKPHTLPQAIAIQDDEQYQLDQSTPAEPVADRIARIENELAMSSSALFKRNNSNQESPSSQPSKIQKIINAQFSSLSSSFSLKQDIPRSRPNTTTNTTTNTNTKSMARYPAQAKSAPNIKATQPAPQQQPSVANRKSLYNELQIQKTIPLQQNEKIRSSTPMPSSVMSSSHSLQSKASRASITNRRSLYHELQSQKNSPSHQDKEKPSAAPNLPSRPAPLPSASQSQSARSPSLIPQSFQLPASPQLPHPSQFPPSQAQFQLPSRALALSSSKLPPPLILLPQDDVPMKEAEAVQDDDDTATSDFFEDLLKARREKAKAQVPLQTAAKTNAPSNDFFGSLLKSSQEKYKNSRPHSSNVLEEEKNTGESTASFLSNLLKASEKRLLQHQQDKGSVTASHGNLSTTLISSQEKHKQHYSLQTEPQTNQEDRGESLRVSSIDTRQPKQQANYKRQSMPLHTVIAADQRKENVPESVAAKAVPPPRPTQMYAAFSKQKCTLQEDRYFTDKRIAKARKVLRESRERTRKWLEAMSPNQPTKH